MNGFDDPMGEMMVVQQQQIEQARARRATPSFGGAGNIEMQGGYNVDYNKLRNVPGAMGMTGALSTALAPVAAALPAVIPAVAGAVGTGLGIAGIAYTIAQALGLGEGEGIIGFDIFGGDTQVLEVPGQDIPLQGPGLAEPEPKYIVWQKRYSWGNMYRLNIRGKTVMASWSPKKGWKTWRPMKMAVIGKKIPTHKSLTRLRHLLRKHQDDAKTILQITQPSALTKNATRQSRWRKK